MKAADGNNRHWLGGALLLAGMLAAPSALAGNLLHLQASMAQLRQVVQARVAADISASLRAAPLLVYQSNATVSQSYAAVRQASEEKKGRKDLQAAQDESKKEGVVEAGDGEVRLDLLRKALATPGLFGMYRSLVVPTTRAANIVAK